MGEVLKLRQYGRKGYTGRKEIYEAILHGTEFDAGHMHGRTRPFETSQYDDLGVLPKEYRDKMVQDQPTYVVFSYLTPIAWYYVSTDDGEEGQGKWRIPDTRYSQTTSRHQGMVRTALVFATEVDES